MNISNFIYCRLFFWVIFKEEFFMNSIISSVIVYIKILKFNFEKDEFFLLLYK